MTWIIYHSQCVLLPLSKGVWVYICIRWDREVFIYQMCFCIKICYLPASQVALVVKNLQSRDVGDVGSIPGSGRFPGGGHGNPLQYSCLENPVDRGEWRATVHRWQRVRHARYVLVTEQAICFNTPMSLLRLVPWLRWTFCPFISYWHPTYLWKTSICQPWVIKLQHIFPLRNYSFLGLSSCGLCGNDPTQTLG